MNVCEERSRLERELTQVIHAISVSYGEPTRAMHEAVNKAVDALVAHVCEHCCAH